MKKIFLLILFLCFFTIITLIIINKNEKDDSIEANSNYDMIYSGNRNSKKIYLTFDDGCTVKNTKKILKTLIEKDVPATFFLDGIFLDNNPGVIKDIVSAGYIIGCHTWNHRDITCLSDNQFRNEIERYETRYKEITGQNITKFFRPPMGKINNQKINILKEYDYTIYYWNVCYYDYNRKNDMGEKYAYEQIMSQVNNGSIILMHTLVDSNASVLPIVIDSLRDKGYIFSSLTDL